MTARTELPREIATMSFEDALKELEQIVRQPQPQDAIGKGQRKGARNRSNTCAGCGGRRSDTDRERTRLAGAGSHEADFVPG